MLKPCFIALALLLGWSAAAADVSLDQRCESLTELTIPAAKITLPTRGSTITASRLVPAGDDNELGEYCLVDGEIASVSESAQPIRFQLALPLSWNQRMLQIGGGGFRGVVISPVVQSSGNILPKNTVGGGYATVGNDSGHQGTSLDASFALHPEQLANYAGDPEFDAFSFDPRSPGSLQPRLLEVVSMLDRVNADIGGYIKQGGKLILVHGLADELPAAQDTVRFYQGQVNRHGEKHVSDAVAFYLVPGQAHGHGSFKATGSMPLLPALETWVSKGVVPGTLTATDTNKNSQGRTRPMCQYPTWTRHDISRRKRGMFDMFVARDLDNDGDMDFVSTRGNSYPYDGVFWLEQVRSKTARQVFTWARREDSEEMPLP